MTAHTPDGGTAYGADDEGAWVFARAKSLEPAAGLLADATAADGLAPISDGLLDAAAAGEAVLLTLVGTDSTEDTVRTDGSRGTDSAEETHSTASAGGGPNADRTARAHDDRVAGAGTGAGPSAASASSDAPGEGTVVGIAVAALQGTRWAAEAVIEPAVRGSGLGRALVTELARILAADGVRAWFWSHGDHPAAAHMARQAGYTRARELLQLSTDEMNSDSIPPVAAPEGIVLRSVEASDASDWARVNNAAFSWHPEQGGQDPAEYAGRLADPEFDRDSVVIAVRTEDHRLAGFHETKMHTDHPSGLRMGEVYVIAVDPDMHARGLGRALLAEGMRRLVTAGAQAIELYVESDNPGALRLYRRAGFTNTVTHVSYAPPED